MEVIFGIYGSHDSSVLPLGIRGDDGTAPSAVGSFTDILPFRSIYVSFYFFSF